MSYNPNKKLQIEIHQNDLSNCNGYTVWRVVNGQRTNTLSRKADGHDFDWMDTKQMFYFEKGGYKFTILAHEASEYFEYIY